MVDGENIPFVYIWSVRLYVYDFMCPGPSLSSDQTAAELLYLCINTCIFLQASGRGCWRPSVSWQ